VTRFTVLDGPLIGLRIVERKEMQDDRGHLSRLFCNEELASAGWRKPIAQVTQSFTRRRGTVRGMHYQLSPRAEMKLVTCLRGAIWDVAVDLRAGSPTILRWHAEELSAMNHRALLIPEGFAHGFQALTEDCELLYLHSEAHSPRHEAGINPRDPVLSISWPVRITGMSTRDEQFPMLQSHFDGVGE
jgi:dTDP-4-dehydrorhamnose 3,5-epimerase